MCGLGLCSCCPWALPALSLSPVSGLLLTARVRGDPPFNPETYTDNGLTSAAVIQTTQSMGESTAAFLKVGVASHVKVRDTSTKLFLKLCGLSQFFPLHVGVLMVTAVAFYMLVW